MSTGKNFVTPFFMPSKSEFEWDRILKDSHHSLRQIDLWFLGFVIGVRHELLEDFSTFKKTTKAAENIGVLLSSEKLHLIEAVYFTKAGFEQDFDPTSLPNKVIRFAHDYAFAGLRKLVDHYNRLGDLGLAFAKAIEDFPVSDSGLQL